MIDGAAPGVGGGDAVADQPLVQRQIRELALLDARTGSASRPGRRAGARPSAWPVARPGPGGAAGRALAVVPGCDRAWAWVIGSLR